MSAGRDAADAAARIEALGEHALLVRFGDRIDPATNARVHRVADRLRAAGLTGLVDLVPAYASLALHFAPDASCEGIDAAHRLVQALLADPDEAGTMSAPRVIGIPVRYGGEDGPDLDAVARHCGLSSGEVIRRHTAAEYRVAMLGFAPGFPYLLGLDPALAVPRLAQPRQRVEAGSVAIGGAQTGIYPHPGPGGWRVIGRTTLELFDPRREPASLLQPGDRVRFVALDA